MISPYLFLSARTIPDITFQYDKQHGVIRVSWRDAPRKHESRMPHAFSFFWYVEAAHFAQSDWPVIPDMPSYCTDRDLPGPRYMRHEPYFIPSSLLSSPSLPPLPFIFFMRISFVHGQNLTNITLTGGGIIDGQGQVW
jgi:hypothetical protein